MAIKQGDNIDFDDSATCINVPDPINGGDIVPKRYIGTNNGTIEYNGELTPPQITANANNYNPTGIRSANFLRVSASGNYNISGIEKPPTGNQGLFIVNVGVTSITFTDNDANSLAKNRFLIGGSKTIQKDEGVMIIYDQTSSRWRSQSINI